MGVLDVYGETKKSEVMQNTWGHLAPKTRNKYFGWILIAKGTYGETIIIDDCFDNLYNSPQQYDDFQDFVHRKTLDFDPGVYKLNGWYMKYKNGNYNISGKFIKINSI